MIVENRDIAAFAVDKVDVLIWVVGGDDDDEFGVEAEIGLNVEDTDIETRDFVRRDLGIVI